MKKEFLTKLRALLDEYDADLFFTFDGDTHGVCNERIEVSINNKVVHTLNGNEVDKYELKNFK